VTAGVQTCRARLADCRCALDLGHDGPHECDGPSALAADTRCMGRWARDGEPIRFPTGAETEADVLLDARDLRVGNLAAVSGRVRARAAALGKVGAP